MWVWVVGCGLVGRRDPLHTNTLGEESCRGWGCGGCGGGGGVWVGGGGGGGGVVHCLCGSVRVGFQMVAIV